jgi:acyl carrier protein
MRTTQTRTQQIARQITDLLGEAHGSPLPVRDGDPQLRSAGLTAIETMTLLVLIEDHFGVTLDEDTPAEALRSVMSIAHFLTDLGV